MLIGGGVQGGGSAMLERGWPRNVRREPGVSFHKGEGSREGEGEGPTYFWYFWVILHRIRVCFRFVWVRWPLRKNYVWIRSPKAIIFFPAFSCVFSSPLLVVDTLPPAWRAYMFLGKLSLLDWHVLYLPPWLGKTFCAGEPEWRPHTSYVEGLHAFSNPFSFSSLLFSLFSFFFSSFFSLFSPLFSLLFSIHLLHLIFTSTLIVLCFLMQGIALP